MKPVDKSVRDEIVSAISALNMKPCKEEKIDYDKYLSEQFRMAAHSIEHMQSALKVLEENTTVTIGNLAEI